MAPEGIIQPLPLIVPETDGGGGGGATHCPPFQLVPGVQSALMVSCARTVVPLRAATVKEPIEIVTPTLVPVTAVEYCTPLVTLRTFGDGVLLKLQVSWAVQVLAPA